MSYNKLVYKLGKVYGQALEGALEGEYPAFAGYLTDLLTDAELADLPDLVDEYVIGYINTEGIRHYLRVYFDEGAYELTGTPMTSKDYSLSIGIFQQPNQDL